MTSAVSGSQENELHCMEDLFLKAWLTASQHRGCRAVANIINVLSAGFSAICRYTTDVY